MTSPGVTGFLNFALSIVVKSTKALESEMSRLFATKTAAVWAIDSICKTPGTTGEDGKCPGKYGSFAVTFFIPVADSFLTISITLSINK